MSRIRGLLKRGLSFIEETVTRIGDPYSGTALLEGLRKSRERGAELALENAQLHDEIETMRKRMNDLVENGHAPMLYSDEVSSLKKALHIMEDDAVPLGRLIMRANHSRLTERQWEENIHAVVMGRNFDPELSPADETRSRTEIGFSDSCSSECTGGRCCKD